MNKRDMKNTKENGSLRFILFEEKEGDFCAVCLDLNLIEYGDDPQKLMASIVEGAQSYIKGIASKNLSDKYLNQPAPEKYWKILEKELKPKLEKDNLSKSKKHSFFNVLNQPYPNFSGYATC